MNWIWDINREFRINLDQCMVTSTRHNKVSGKYDVLITNALGVMHVSTFDTEADAKTEAMRLTSE